VKLFLVSACVDRRRLAPVVPSPFGGVPAQGKKFFAGKIAGFFDANRCPFLTMQRKQRRKFHPRIIANKA
jgi:hypothetical protein